MDLYRDILKKALKISWQNKWLWVLGFFAALAGNGGEYEIIARNLKHIENEQVGFNNFRDFLQSGGLSTVSENLKEFFLGASGAGSILILLLVALGLSFLWLMIVSQGGLINGIYQTIKGKKSLLSENFRFGRKVFWKILGVNVIRFLFVLFFLLIVDVPLIGFYLISGKACWVIAAIIYSFIILIPISVIVEFISKYALLFIVTTGDGAISGLKKGWQLFLKNWIISLEMAVVLFLANIVFGLILISSVIAVSLPFVFIGIMFLLTGLTIAVNVTAIIGVLLISVLIILAGSWLSTFQYTSWVQLFVKLNEEKLFSKIARSVNSAVNYFQERKNKIPEQILEKKKIKSKPKTVAKKIATRKKKTTKIKVN